MDKSKTTKIGASAAFSGAVAHPAAVTESNGNAEAGSSVSFDPQPVPASVRVEFDATAEQLGGPYAPSPESAGAVGHTHFDGPEAQDGSVTVLIEKKNLDAL